MPVTRKKKASGPRKGAKWSATVTSRSNALDLEPGVFRKSSPRAIAASLKRSAVRRRRIKGNPFRSAMSMLAFFVNRAGRTLDEGRRRILDRAKDELRRLFGRAPRATHPQAHAHARQ